MNNRRFKFSFGTSSLLTIMAISVITMIATMPPNANASYPGPDGPDQKVATQGGLSPQWQIWAKVKGYYGDTTHYSSADFQLDALTFYPWSFRNLQVHWYVNGFDPGWYTFTGNHNGEVLSTWKTDLYAESRGELYYYDVHIGTWTTTATAHVHASA
jgi:hypothetical protein